MDPSPISTSRLSSSGPPEWIPALRHALEFGANTTLSGEFCRKVVAPLTRAYQLTHRDLHRALPAFNGENWQILSDAAANALNETFAAEAPIPEALAPLATFVDATDGLFNLHSMHPWAIALQDTVQTSEDFRVRPVRWNSVVRQHDLAEWSMRGPALEHMLGHLSQIFAEHSSEALPGGSIRPFYKPSFEEPSHVLTEWRRGIGVGVASYFTFKVWADAPYGLIVHRDGLPRAVVSYVPRNNSELMVVQLQGIRPENDTSNFPDPIGSRFRLGLLAAAEEVARILGYRQISVQGGERNLWTRPNGYAALPHLTKEQARCIYNGTARQRGYTKRANGDRVKSLS